MALDSHGRAVEVMRRPPSQRDSSQISQLVPWLKKKCAIMQGMADALLCKILQNCDYIQAPKDDVIIRQGEKGDRLYITLSGSVSVYIDASKSGEDDAMPGDDVMGRFPQMVEEPPTQARGAAEAVGAAGAGVVELTVPHAGGRDRAASIRSQASQGGYQPRILDRTKFGKFVIKFEAGKVFGEIALISDNNVRNASIVSDEESDFMVIHKELYSTTLKEYQEREFQERRLFVRTCPIFSGWSAKFRRLLEMSLIRETFAFNSNLISQGEPFRGLVFLLQGRARVSVEPDRHVTQYSHLMPFTTQNDVYQLEFQKPQKRVSDTRMYESPSVRLPQVEVRRRGGYAAAEKRQFHRQIPLCLVSEGEIFGDLELTLNLKTHVTSVTCATQCDVFILTPKNIERLLTRRQRSTLELLRTRVMKQLAARERSQQGRQVVLFQHLLFRLAEDQRPSHRKAPLEEEVRKELPPPEVLFQHQLDAFVHSRAELLPPYVTGGVYLREKMRERARLREKTKWRKHQPAVTWTRARHRKRNPSAKPRSIKHLKVALRRQEESAAASERDSIVTEYRDLETLEMAEIARQAHESLEDHGTEPDSDIYQRLQKAKKFMAGTAMKSDDVRGDDVRGDADTIHNTAAPVDTIDDVITHGDPRDTSRAIFVTDVPRRPADPRDKPPDPQGRQPDPQGAPPMEAPSYPQHPEAPQHPAACFLPPLNDATEVIVDTEHVAMAIDPRHRARMRFLRAIMRHKTQAAPDNPEYRDWQTSDKSLHYLEERIKNFKIRRDATFVKLPHLPRFENKAEPLQPLPGGKVLVKRKPRNQRPQRHVTSNDHVTHQMVGELPDSEELRRAKMYSYKVVDGLRDSWLTGSESGGGGGGQRNGGDVGEEVVTREVVSDAGAQDHGTKRLGHSSKIAEVK